MPADNDHHGPGDDNDDDGTPNNDDHHGACNNHHRPRRACCPPCDYSYYYNDQSKLGFHGSSRACNNHNDCRSDSPVGFDGCSHRCNVGDRPCGCRRRRIAYEARKSAESALSGGGGSGGGAQRIDPERLARETWKRCRTAKQRSSEVQWEDVTEAERDAWLKGSESDLREAGLI